MSSTRSVTTAAGPVDAVVDVPGSKSIANRALVCAALADGDSVLDGMPDGDDTVAMAACLSALGVGVTVDGATVLVAGSGGVLTATDVRLDAALAGTTSRFVTAVAALAPGPIVVDGGPPLRRRPMGPLHDALRQLGAAAASAEAPGTLPVTVTGPLTTGGTVRLAGDVSSQYLTALMLIGPRLEGGVTLELTTPLVSAPYVQLTASVMSAFGVDGVDVSDDRIVVPPGRYRGRTFTVEPDASSASYPLALAAVAGGRVRIRGLSRDSAQGDVAFAELLVRMGCRSLDGTEVGVERDLHQPLVGVDIDMADVSDLVPTLAAVAATASTPTRIRGVGFIRDKESDRLGDLADGLSTLGAHVEVVDDGLRIAPAALHGGIVATHHDHRLAMAYGVVGAVVPGVRVSDPDVVSKSWPGYWDVRDAVVAGSRDDERAVIAAFDVDGTLTTGDCVVPFLRLVAGTAGLAGGLGRRAAASTAALARRDRDALKAIAARAVFAGRPIAQIEGLGRTFAARVAARGLREDAVARLRWHQRQGHQVVLVSASFGAYLRPLAEHLSAGATPVAVLATELETRDGLATGELVDGNCRGPEKRRRLERWLDDSLGGRDAVELWAYGDSPGDRELLAAADHPVLVGSRLAPTPEAGT